MKVKWGLFLLKDLAFYVINRWTKPVEISELMKRFILNKATNIFGSLKQNDDIMPRPHKMGNCFQHCRGVILEQILFFIGQYSQNESQVYPQSKIISKLMKNISTWQQVILFCTCLKIGSNFLHFRGVILEQIISFTGREINYSPSKTKSHSMTCNG